MDKQKLDFAGEAWISAARDVLEELVATHGEDGRSFSVCEIFTNAPAHVAADGVAAWHFRIDGRSVVVAAGIAPDTDVCIEADYQAALPSARLIYTPEIIARRSAERTSGPRPGVRGDMSKAPSYLVELHNRLAELTA
ncbi:MAG: hypothetical protein R3E86_19015 [Pseudomonadales bacterium]